MADLVHRPPERSGMSQDLAEQAVFKTRRPRRSSVSSMPHPSAFKEVWDTESLIVFLVMFAIYAAVGWYASMVLQVYDVGGIQRMAQAQEVFFSRDPHLASIGLVSPPLPVMIDMPLVLVLKPLGLVLFSGPIMSAFFSALAAAQVASLLRGFGFSLAWRLPLLLAFAVNRLVLHDAATGLSEAGLLAFLLLSLNGFVSWEKTGKIRGLMMAGVGSGLAFYCRYEALAWAAAMILAISWVLWLRGEPRWGGPVEGSVLWFAIPLLWMVPLWMLINWQIAGNPIYFVVGQDAMSNTPDTASMVGASHAFFFAYHSLLGSARLVWQEVVDLAPLLLPGSAFLVLGVIWRRKWESLAYLMLAWSILCFTFLTAYRGLLPDLSRYFFWAVPGGFIVAAAAHQAAKPGWVRGFIAAATLLLAVYSAVMLPYQGWLKLSGDPTERVATALLVPPETFGHMTPHAYLSQYKEIANYLNQQAAGTLTIADAALAAPMVFFMSRPSDLVLTADRDFFTILREPVHKADQILVPYPTFDSRGRSEILTLYPDIYEEGADWARPVKEFSGPEPWKLFQIVE